MGNTTSESTPPATVQQPSPQVHPLPPAYPSQDDYILSIYKSHASVTGCAVRNDAALRHLAQTHTDLAKVDPSVLTVALFNAMGYSNSVGSDAEFYPPPDFVIYLEFIEHMLPYSDSPRMKFKNKRTTPAASLSAAAYSFLERRHSKSPSFPRDLSESWPGRASQWPRPLKHTLRSAGALHSPEVGETQLAQHIFQALGLELVGPCPSPEFVILLEFVDAQITNPTLHSRKAPATSLVGAAYYLLFRRAGARAKLPHRENFYNVLGVKPSAGDERLLRLVEGHPDLTEAHPALLSVALYLSIGLNTDALPFRPDPEAVIQAEFLDDKRYCNPDRASPAKTLVDAAYYYLKRRCTEIPVAGE
ncbi:hypothetical protein FA95DRAFT_1576141 [Auriscalpium vulgare]|uniref:Uncharacterized protein n=1 Tax=Auriscalpium vulgare TaxID=40419 RepID=A0ACB8RD43_9AGAM|nr:hypothetical protein FA95DRAFT_1576141 [Auriscalpium vulgare]